MNHIKRLQDENARMRAALATLNTNADIFLAHLHSAKFTGEANGERKDWIATGDVIRWIHETRGDVNNIANG